MRARYSICAAAVVAVLAAGAVAFGATYASPDSSVVVTASAIELAQNRVVATGRARVVAADKAAGTKLEADAAKIQVVFLGDPGARPGIGSVKNAEMAGPVKMVYTSARPGEAVTTVSASADSASYDGKTGVAKLTGNVKITSDDPSRFATPAVMTGDVASVNLRADLGPEDFRFRLESSPGVSRIEVTPKPQEKPDK